jgi:hypothetical protein
MSGFACKFCAHGNPEGAKFCNECGSPLHLAPCPRCEAINNAADAQCVQCGAPLSRPSASPVSAARALESSPAAVALSIHEEAVPPVFAERLDAFPWEEGAPAAKPLASVEDFAHAMAEDALPAAVQVPVRAAVEEPALATAENASHAVVEAASPAMVENPSVATIEDPLLAATLDGDPTGLDHGFSRGSARIDAVDGAAPGARDDRMAGYPSRKRNRAATGLILGAVLAIAIVGVALYKTSLDSTHAPDPPPAANAAPKTAAEPETPAAAASAPTDAPTVNSGARAASAPASETSDSPTPIEPASPSVDASPARAESSSNTAAAPASSPSEPPKPAARSKPPPAKTRTSANAPRRAVAPGRTAEQAERDATATRRLITRELADTPQTNSDARPPAQ